MHPVCPWKVLCKLCETHGYWGKTKWHQEVFYPISSTMMQHNYASAISKGNLINLIFTVPSTTPDREITSYAMLSCSFHACGKCSALKPCVQREQFNCQTGGCQRETCALCAFTNQRARKDHIFSGLQENAHKEWWGWLGDGDSRMGGEFLVSSRVACLSRI